MIAIGIIFTLLYFFFDPTKKKIFAIPCSIFVIFYSLSFDLIDNEQLGETIFRYSKFQYGIRSIIFYFFTLFGLLFGIILAKYSKQTVLVYQWYYNIDKVKKIYYILALGAMIGFGLNFSHIYSNLGLMFISPRDYQNSFGENSLVNYLYFLNVPTLCISVLCKSKNIFLKHSLTINFFMVIMSFFHGIKFTIFDTILYPSIFYFLLSKKNVFKQLIIIGVLLIVIFMLFAEFVRGGAGKSPVVAFLGYILPNYYNIGWVVENHTSNFGEIGALILPIGTPSPTTEISNVVPIDDLFIFSPSYNMFTALHLMYNAFNILAPLIIYPIIFLIQIWLYRRRKVSLTNFWLSTYLEICLYFAFYFYAYMKLKFLFYCCVFYAIDRYCRSKKHSCVSEEGQLRKFFTI